LLKIYNSLTNKKEVFIPNEPGKIAIYICGMTVYDLCHLGHARTVVAFDMIVRYLRSQGYQVTYVRNITDVDDKIIKKSQEANINSTELTATMITAMEEDFAALGNTPPDHQPRATEYINEMIAMIQKLITKGYAYTSPNGDVFYRTDKFTNYGQLSGKVTEELSLGHRIQIDSHKEDPKDFVLWKPAKANEPSWDSPWGMGRPGWHIECSAMSKAILGNNIDIHCGGIDLQFPHHENEIAQSEACNDCKFSNYWLHTGAIRIDNEKMSKSLGNFFTIRDILEQHNAEAVRFFLLSSHYRSPINYSESLLEQAQIKVTKLYTALENINLENYTAETNNSEFFIKFTQAMNDDFNTANALAVLFDLAKQLNISKKLDSNQAQTQNLAYQLKNLGNILGILQQNPSDYLRYKATEDITETEINELITKRNNAKKEKNFALADEIRVELESKNIILQDSRNGTTWRKK
jgi:cysteinyl-tRNA synthetase